MMQHVIRLPNGRHCTVGTYVKAWRALLAAPGDAQVSGFGHFPEDASRVLRAMRDAMHDRINRHLAYYNRGRKWDWRWQRDVARVAWNLNGRRIVTREREVPREYRARLAHRLACNWE